MLGEYATLPRHHYSSKYVINIHRENTETWQVNFPRGRVRQCYTFFYNSKRLPTSASGGNSSRLRRTVSEDLGDIFSSFV